MNKIPELNPIEKKLKQFYRKSKERMLDVPCTRDEIMDVLLSSYTAMPDKNITWAIFASPRYILQSKGSGRSCSISSLSG